MGISGIIGGLVDGSARNAWAERGAFIAALIAVPAVLQGGLPVVTGAATAPALLIAAGLCVGIGTRIANGCTSGHGVCGISRFSVRGIVATLVYIGAGVVAVVILRLVMGGL